MPASSRLFALVLLCLMAAGCTREGPEARLRAAVDALGAAIEARDAGDIEDALATDFIGPDAMDREGARRLAALTFMRYRDVGVTLGPARIEMGEGHATVAFEALLTGGSGAVLPESARAYRVKTGWTVEDGEWKVQSVDWDSAGP